MDTAPERRADAPERYHRLQLRLSILSAALGAGFLVVMAWTGAARALATLAHRLAPTWWGEVAVVALGLGLAHAVLTFPLSWVRSYRLPRRYGLLHQPWPAWLGDRLKAGALGALFTLFAVELTYGLLRATPHWWLVAALAFSIASVAIATVFPIWIVPLFYRLTPLADTGLRERLLALASRAGVSAIGVYVLDHSRKSRTANAALTGIGRTRRIVLFDTLVTSFRPAEVESVLAHELAHHVHADVWRGLAIQVAVTVASLYAADVVLRATAPALGLTGLDDPAGLPWLALVISAVGLVALPLVNTASRVMEQRADDFALDLTRDPEAFVAAMERLGRVNLAEERPARWKEIMLFSHPPLERRIARARRRANTP